MYTEDMTSVVAMFKDTEVILVLKESVAEFIAQGYTTEAPKGIKQPDQPVG